MRSATLVFGAIGWTFDEWIFWLPSRREIILRTPRPSKNETRDEIVGVEGTVVSELKPIGVIRVQGTDRSARSSLGHISKGAKVVVEAVGDFELVVRNVEGEPSRRREPSAGP